MSPTYFENGTPLIFNTEDDAYDYARDNKTCLEAADGCVYCFRWDH